MIRHFSIPNKRLEGNQPEHEDGVIKTSGGKAKLKSEISEDDFLKDFRDDDSSSLEDLDGYQPDDDEFLDNLFKPKPKSIKNEQFKAEPVASTSRDSSKMESQMMHMSIGSSLRPDPIKPPGMLQAGQQESKSDKNSSQHYMSVSEQSNSLYKNSENRRGTLESILESSKASRRSLEESSISENGKRKTQKKLSTGGPSIDVSNSKLDILTEEESRQMERNEQFVCLSSLSYQLVKEDINKPNSKKAPSVTSQKRKPSENSAVTADVPEVQLDNSIESAILSQETSTANAADIPAKKSFGTGRPLFVSQVSNLNIKLRKKFKLAEDCFFDDGCRRIDMVLAYQPKFKSKMESRNRTYRHRFETKMKNIGLELEHQDLDQSQDGKTCFVKIHASWDFLVSHADRIGMRKPIAPMDIGDMEKDQGCCSCGALRKKNQSILDADDEENNERGCLACFRLKSSIRREKLDLFCTAFNKEYLQCFMGSEDPETFFTESQRIQLVDYAMQRCNVPRVVSGKNGKTSKKKKDMEEEESPELLTDTVSYQWLLHKKIYIAQYPLHDCDVDDPRYKDMETTDLPMRKWLKDVWGNLGASFKYQPLDAIRGYFGGEIGLYFAWLGFYVKFLILPSIISFVCLFIGIGSSFQGQMPKLFCSEQAKNITLCRRCPDETCPYSSLTGFCKRSQIARLFDNGASFAFAVIISIWAVLFLELWKRYQARLVSHWDININLEREDIIRPEFQFKVKTKRRNPITREDEPFLSQNEKCRRFAVSIGTILTFLSALLIFLIGMIAYRAMAAILINKAHIPLIKKIGSGMMGSISASILNLVFISFMSYIYPKVARWLTEFERPRTKREYESSFIYKVVLFQFINFYGTLFYLAFFKGKITQPPHKRSIFNAPCPPSGCMLDLTIQLIIIMTIKQMFQNVMEVSIPALKNRFRRLGTKTTGTAENKFDQWEKDFIINDVTIPTGFGDYLEMIIQYGFVVMFSPTFPLATFFALLNNIMEIRIDAIGYLTDHRRPIPLSVANLGAWQEILETITRISVVVNAFMIAFSSSVIEKFVYQMHASVFTTERDFLRTLFSTFNTSDYAREMSLQKAMDLRYWPQRNKTVELCFYSGFFEDAGSPNEYKYRNTFWMLFLIRMVFVVVFEHLVFTIQTLIQVLIPDIPGDVQLKSLREQYLSNLIFTKAQEQTAQADNIDPGNANNKQVKKPSKDMPDKIQARKEKTKIKAGVEKIYKAPRMKAKAVAEVFNRKGTNQVAPKADSKVKKLQSKPQSQKQDIENGWRRHESSEESDADTSDEDEPFSEKRQGFFLTRFLRKCSTC